MEAWIADDLFYSLNLLEYLRNYRVGNPLVVSSARLVLLLAGPTALKGIVLVLPVARAFPDVVVESDT